MTDVWMTHPNLTPAHDFKAATAAVGTWMGSGWQVRKGQSDPVVVDEPADPRPPVEPAPEPVDEPADPRLAVTESAPESVGEPAVEFAPVKPVPSPRSPKES